MIIIEAHDTEFDNLEDGTLAGIVGRQGTIEYEYQAEQWLGDIAAEGHDFTRAYFLKDGVPIAAWLHDGGGEFRCIGYSADYGGAWRTETSYVYPDAMLIVSMHLGRNALTGSQEEWAAAQLVGATAAAVLFDEQGIVAAWEPAQPGLAVPTLTARGPRRQLD